MTTNLKKKVENIHGKLISIGIQYQIQIDQII